MTRILLVEDDVDLRLIMEHVLIDGGYQVDTTSSVRAPPRNACSNAAFRRIVHRRVLSAGSSVSPRLRMSRNERKTG